MRSRSLLLLAATVGVAACVTRVDLPWGAPTPGTGGARQKRVITIDGAQVARQLAGFPVLVRVDADADLQSVANGGSVWKDDGSDLRFADASGTALPFELEQYDPATGALLAWVRLAVIASNVQTTFVLTYGSGGTLAQNSPQAAWAEYRGVWHLDGDPSGAAPQEPDSTSHADGGTAAPAMSTGGRVTGQIGSAIHLDGSHALELANSVPAVYQFGTSTAFTVSLWVDATTVGAYDTAFWAGGDTPGDTGYDIALGSGHWSACMANATAQSCADFTAAPQDGAWHLLTLTVNSPSGTAVPYVDGAPGEGPTTGVPSALRPTVQPQLGGTATDPYTGSVDELRLRQGAETDAWIAAEYANQKSSSTFLTIGPAQKAP